MTDVYLEIREKLRARRDELTNRLDRISADVRHVRDPLDRDSKERVVQLVNDDVLDALDDAGRAEVAAIDRTLARIDSGEYGTCQKCDGPIGPPRLRALPTAQYCIECAATMET
jgi:RNA polymerase-binding protein DksA